jgi:hypothetical protein
VIATEMIGWAAPDPSIAHVTQLASLLTERFLLMQGR